MAISILAQSFACLLSQMDVCPIPALLGPSVLATQMAAGNVARVLLAMVEMASSAKILMR